MENVYNNKKNLPHYLSRKESGIGKEEPIYLNDFLVTFIPPAGVTGAELLSVSVTSMDGLDNLDPGVSPVEQTYKGYPRSFLGGNVDDPRVDVNFSFNANLDSRNRFYVYKTLREWKNKGHNIETGEKGLKVDYTGQIIIEFFRRNGDVYRRVTLYDCFITSQLPPFSGDYTSPDLYTLDGVTFRADAHKQEFL